MDMDEKLGKRIAALRRKRGWTQEKLAQQLGVSAAAVSKWETGAAYPDIALLCPLARRWGRASIPCWHLKKKCRAEQLAACTERFVGFVRQDDREAAHAYMKGLLREYPADCDLKLKAAGGLQCFK